jgi:hypothetical protein
MKLHGEVKLDKKITKSRRIRVESKPGKGLRFVFALPMAKGGRIE